MNARHEIQARRGEPLTPSQLREYTHVVKYFGRRCDIRTCVQQAEYKVFVWVTDAIVVRVHRCTQHVGCATRRLA